MLDSMKAEEVERDRRAYPRFRASLFIDLGVGSERAVAARVENISLSGLLCVVDDEVAAPGKVVAMINIPGAYPVEAEGSIVRRKDRPDGIELGVAFSKVGEEDIATLRGFLKDLS
jgi:hypothetical protein